MTVCEGVVDLRPPSAAAVARLYEIDNGHSARPTSTEGCSSCPAIGRAVVPIGNLDCPCCHREATPAITLTALPLVGGGVLVATHRAHNHGDGGRVSGRPKCRGAVGRRQY